MTAAPENKRDRLRQWLASGDARLQPLSFPQRELWEASPVPVAAPAQHICCLIKVRGLITPSECEVALGRVVQRQEVLRLSILPGKERPLQMIRENVEPNIRFRTLSSAQHGDEAVDELAEEVFAEPFDLVQGPLYRVEVLERAADDHVLVLAIHHAIADGWTLGVFVQDLGGAYLQERMGLREALPAVPLSYTAWGAAERAFWQPAQLAPRAAYWRDALAGRKRLWAPDTAPGRRTRWVTSLPPDLTQLARDLARRHGATLFSTLLTVFQGALSQWTGADDILVGTPVANRGSQAVRETMGYFASVVPLRGRIDGTRKFSETLREVQGTTTDGLANAMPLAELLQAVPEPAGQAGHPIFEVRFALQNHPIHEIALPSLSARLSMRSTGTARFDLGCEITEQGDSLEVVWLFRPGLFTQADVEEAHRLFAGLLTKAGRAPESRLSALLA